MPPKLALFVFVVLILWFFLKERKSRGPLSSALWLPLTWAFLLGSRPLSEWLGGGSAGESAINYLEGSPMDRLLLFSLIAAGLLVLLRRKERWGEIIWNNKWIFALYSYLLLSVLWSDYSYVSFKRWVKDFGNVIMALVILTEVNPREAFKSVLLRCSFLLIPLSVLLAKYYPDLGRYYSRWTHASYFSGVADDKNLLGMMLFVCGVFLFSLYLERRQSPEASIPPSMLYALMLMSGWLLIKAQSVTAVVCTFVSVCTLYIIHRYGMKRLLVYGLIFSVLAVFALSVVSVSGIVGSVMGRDTTLTGRTEIWTMLLNEKVNPMVGVGFYSFWLGERTGELLRKNNRSINEAHNGYIEMYLNSGLLGLILLFGLLGASIRSYWRDLKFGIPGAAFGFCFLIGTILYNVTEATFNRMSIIWFTFLIIVVSYRRSHDGSEEILDAAASVIPAEETAVPTH